MHKGKTRWSPAPSRASASALHFIADDLTLPSGRVLHDCKSPAEADTTAIESRVEVTA